MLRARDDNRRAAAPERQAAGRTEPARTARAPKLSWKEQLELKELPARIEALEREQGALARQLADPGFYSSQPAHQVREANSRHQEPEALLLAALERWTELEARGAGNRLALLAAAMLTLSTRGRPARPRSRGLIA